MDDGEVITATEVENGLKVKIRSSKRVRPVTATLKRVKGEKVFRYNYEYWYPERPPWQIVINEGS